jgi:tetraacyldisaccharide 4'-kinase
VDHRVVERLWFGRDPAARAGRAALAPAAWLYGAVVRARNAAYDRDRSRTHDLALPALSVGNLTVGGTGKTPVAADLAGRLARRGARPAIVLRGYGDDEPLVHERLNPGIVVVAAPDRVAGVAEAARRGADVAVLDDAFQHRRARRLADVVLLSADRWAADPRRLLPAGPWREPLAALARATLVVVTRKAAADADVRAALAACERVAPDVPAAVAALRPAALRAAAGAPSDAEREIGGLAGARVLAVAAVGDPAAFLRQLEAAGASVTPRTFADHHRFTDDDVDALVQASAGAELVVCTLKDAVKLAPRWPRAARTLWYVTQAVVYERGDAALDRVLDRLLAARSTPT